jgi:hypothetical protein
VSAVVVIVVVLIGQPLLTIVAITASVHSLSFFDFCAGTIRTAVKITNEMAKFLPQKKCQTRYREPIEFSGKEQTRNQVTHHGNDDDNAHTSHHRRCYL